jgi:large subunit ribosomal protein L13
MNTVFPSEKDIARSWFVLDAENAVLGRLASKAARILMGKHRPRYTTFLDTGDHVVVINAAKVRLTGRKEEQKLYRRHSGYPGGFVEISAKKLKAANPRRMVEDAIFGMLPKTKLGKQMYRKLKVYAGDKHPHQAQQPQSIPAVD